MYVREGTVTRGHYSGGEWCERLTQIEARGITMKYLDLDVIRLTKEHSSKGSTIDFGYTDNTSNVNWSDDVYEKVPVVVRSEIYKTERMVHRKHTITSQRDSTIAGEKKWIAACGNVTGYGTSQEEAIDWVVRKLEGKYLEY